MQERIFWSSWADFLQRWNLNGLVTLFLETAGPFKFFAVQLMNFGHPFFSSRFQADEWSALIDLLEDSQESDLFIKYLNREIVS